MKEPLRSEKSAGTLTISTLIVDDEQLAREELAYLLKAHPDVHIVGQGHNGLEALQLIRELEPDLLFLDVQMPGLDGFGVIKKLIEKKVRLPHIVFATAYDHYAVQAFDVNAVDYLLKPIDKVRLARSVHRARRLVETPAAPNDRLEALLQSMAARTPARPRLLVKSQNRLILVDAGYMIYATIEDGSITVVAQNIEGISNYKTIEDLQEALDPQAFWRVHRSYLVNINRIREVVPWFKSSYMLRMDDKKNSEIPVSRGQTKRLRELFNM